MKEQIITREVKEVNGYIADDGTWFKHKDDCQRYEESAKMVVRAMIKEKIVGTCSQYELLGGGCDDIDIEFFNIDSMETLELANRYAKLAGYSGERLMFKTEDIGKIVGIEWDYDHIDCWRFGNIDEVIENIRKQYKKKILKEE